MKKINISLTALALLTGIMVGDAIEMVGKLPENRDQPFSQDLPILILGFILVPAILGFMAAKESED